MELFLKTLRKTGIFLAAVIGSVVSLFVLVSLAVWLRTPVYDFSEPVKFSGNRWYNPYDGLDSSSWYRANFHAHSAQWGGLTNGKDNTDGDVFSTYRKMGYQFATLSNYQRITEKAMCGFPYIPAQEYGINILKTHLLLIGSTENVYVDQPFIQGTHTKQDRINRNRHCNEIIVLAHPQWNGGFTAKDIRRLGGYDLIEVLNHFRNSIQLWDTALSCGKPAFLLASDDTHNVFRNKDIADKVTMVPHDARYARFIYSTLRNGSSYGIDVSKRHSQLSAEEKAEILDSYPVPVSIWERNDTIGITLSAPVMKIRFISDGGREIASAENTACALCTAGPEDTYVRAEAYLEDGTFMLFNPVIRSEDGSRPAMPAVEKLKWATNLKTALAVSGLIIAYLILRRKLKRKGRR